MDEYELLRLIRRYDRLVARNQVHALTHECGWGLLGMMDKDNKVFLMCYSCQSKEYPGQRLIDTIKEAIERTGF